MMKARAYATLCIEKLAAYRSRECSIGGEGRRAMLLMEQLVSWVLR